MSNHLETLVALGEGVDLDGLFDRPAWQLDAVCRGHPVEMFFPQRGASNDEAKAICARCPVTAQGLAYALDGADIGIWAGRPAEAVGPLTDGGKRDRIDAIRLMAMWC